MQRMGKGTIIAIGLGVALVLAVAAVKASSAGEDFEWLSVDDGGIAMNGYDDNPEGEGDDYPTIQFENLEGENGLIAGNVGITVMAHEGGEPKTALILQSDTPISPETELKAGLVSVSGDVGVSAGHLDGEDFVPHASVYCTQGGDVVVQLGLPEDAEGEQMMAVQGESASQTSEVANAPANGTPGGTSATRLRYPVNLPRIPAPASPNASGN